jgi:2,3-dihydroxybenzoate decarboxylase
LLCLRGRPEAAEEIARAGGLGGVIRPSAIAMVINAYVKSGNWAKAEELQAPIYLHPADPVQPYASFGSFKELTRATWGWGVETGTHALRMIFGGVFDRFPKALLMLGHLGETLPYLLWRFDSRAKLYGVSLKRQPSEYIKDNIAVTVSGMFSAEPLNCAVAALGGSRVMFSADYPFESAAEAGHFMDDVSLDEALREDICWRNAARILNIPMQG